MVGSSRYGSTGSGASWERWDAGLIPGRHSGLRILHCPAEPRMQVQLGSDPWPRELQMPRGSQKRKRGKKRNASLRRQPGTSTLLTHRAGPSFSALNLPVLGFVLLSKEKVHPQSGWKCFLTSKVNYPLEPPLLRILRLNSICSLPAAQRTSHVSLPAPQLSSTGLDGAFCWNS